MISHSFLSHLQDAWNTLYDTNLRLEDAAAALRAHEAKTATFESVNHNSYECDELHSIAIATENLKEAISRLMDHHEGG